MASLLSLVSPQLPLTFVSVPQHVTQRIARDKKKERKAIAAEIEANPLANDDSPAREDLPEWIPPTFTGGMFDLYAIRSV
jgi:hypothetical protein